MKIAILSRRIVVAVFLLLPLPSFAGHPYNAIYVFGDSLSDMGNYTSLFGPLPEPPYYQGSRLTSGKVAVEVMAEHLALPLNPSLHLIGFPAGNNFATAGAMAAGNTPIDLPTQLQMFFLAHEGIAPADALYVIFIGGNDIRAARNEPDDIIASAYLKTATHTVGNLIRELHIAGARHFLVVNAPDIGSIPETSLVANSVGDSLLALRAAILSRYFNRKLDKELRIIRRTTNAAITRFDLLTRVNTLIRLGPVIGFSNTTDGCFSLFTGLFHPDCDAGSNVDSFFFVDEIHPTARIHQYIGDALARAVSFREHRHRPYHQ